MPHSAGKTNKQKHLIARTVLKKIFKKMFKKNSQGGKQEGPVFLSIERNSERIRKNMLEAKRNPPGLGNLLDLNMMGRKGQG